MTKFSKGDKVESVKTGAKGVVDEVYGEEKYAVLFDGSTNPDRVEGFQIKAANAKACNGKFKVGDSVRLVKGPAPSVGDFGKVVNVYTLTEDMAKSMGFGDYVGQDIVTFFGKGGKHIVPEAWVVAANSAPISSTNSVVQNAINARRARNAEGYDNSLGREVDRLADRIAKKFKEHAESYAYWIEADCGRQVDALLRDAKQDKSVQPSIIAELERLRRRVNDAVAASKNLPR